MVKPLTSARACALLSPSARIVAASADADGGVARAGSLPWNDVHWPTLVALASFERAEAQVFSLLRHAPHGLVPDDVVRAMQAICRVAVFRAAELSDAAGVAVDAMLQAGIQALWLKGAALAMQSAEGFALRSMGDMDLLVTPAQVFAAQAALRAAGWSDDGADGSYAGHHHEAPLFWRGANRIELHTGLFPPGHPFTDGSADEWIARGTPIKWAGRDVLVLPAAWHVVHASVHWAWSHEGAVGSWQYLYDVRRLTGNWKAESGVWGAVRDHAERLRASRPAGWGLWTASRLGDLRDMDEAVVERLRGARSLLRGVAEREWVLRAFHSPMSSPSVAWSRFWWRKAMGGLGDDDRSWPWAAGRTAVAASGAVATEASAHGARAAMTKWRLHLGRVLNA